MITVKRLDTEDEIRGKAYVHWRCWQEAYAGLVSAEYLRRFTLDKSTETAFLWCDRHLIAKDGDRVIGFLCFGDRGEEAPGVGEIFALYVLPAYWGKGVSQKLMDAGLSALRAYPKIALWVLKENARAIRFYEKCGFRKTGEQMYSPTIDATEIRMLLER